jgi:hypothetical protein
VLKTVNGDKIFTSSSIFQWFKRLKDGRKIVQDDPRSGRPSTSRNADTIASVREMATWDHQWALRMMADESNISKETVRQILYEDLRERMMCASSSHTD